MALSKTRREFISYVYVGLVSLSLGYLCSSFFLSRVLVRGSSMEETLRSGRVVWVNKLDRTPKRGDIVVANVEGTSIIKRVVAEGGDRVKISNGELFVNGVSVKEGYIKHTSMKSGILENELAVSKDSYILLGDNRRDSVDSREYGEIPQEKIVGKVLGVK